MPKPNDKIDLLMVEVRHHGHIFRTGSAVTFRYTRNLVSARSLGLPVAYLHQFQTDIEPAGMYLILDEMPNSPAPTPEWEKGTITFRNPLVIKFNGRDVVRYDDQSWKVRLSSAFNNQKGKALTAALKAAGYDGIVTACGNYTSEIVKL